MKRIKTSELTPGMILAEDVFNYSGQMIFPRGLSLSDNSISRLTLYSILSVKVEDVPEQIPNPEIIASSYSERVQSSAEFKQFKADFEQGVDNFRSSVNDIVEKNAPIDTDALLKEALSIFDSKKSKANIFTMLQNMRQYDDLTFAHSMNVSLIANVFATWLHMSNEDAETLTLCGLLHDIGKLMIPDSIIKKPSKLTSEEFAIVKTHPNKGYDILKKAPIDPRIKMATLMHHEKCDGSGYPQGLSSHDIDSFAKIISIADVYDAMTSARIYRGPLCPFQVVELFEAEGLQKYDTHYILTFLENVVYTYMNNNVELNDGQQGEIVFINKQNLSKPMIRSKNGFIDLSKHKELSVVKII